MLGTVKKGDASLQDWVTSIAEEYEQVMIAGIMNHERSQQTLIGPSEIGNPCNRAMLYKLAKTPERNRRPAWKPAVGTACHSQEEQWFSTITTPNGTTPADWEVEQKVAIGNIGPDPIYGSTDLYFKAGCVIDHKFVGKPKLKKVKAADSPGELYRVQAHSYGRGWALDGFPVHAVMIVFHPRDGELDESYYWWEPYDEAVALAALKRANQLYALLTGLGLVQALNLFSYCPDPYCDWCTSDQAANYDPHPATTPAPAPALFAAPAAETAAPAFYQ